MKSVNINDIDIDISVENTTDDRMTFEWTIELAGQQYREANLKSGCGADPSESEMLGTLLTFLGAAGESYRYDGMEGESSNLFPEPVVKWASENVEEIALAQYDLEEGIERARKAREAAYDWHGGQWSALYAFASSGICEEKGELFSELENCLVLADEEEKEAVIELMQFADSLPFDTELDAWVAPWHDEHFSQPQSMTP